MEIKQLILDEIERKGLDGLWCQDMPCGCLKNDLAPCGMLENLRYCEMGKRIDYKADEACGCDGQGTDHWHICDPSYRKPSEGEKRSGIPEEIIHEVVDLFRQKQRASVSSIQRHLRVGYTEAARIMDEMEARGLVGPSRGLEPRKLFLPEPTGDVNVRKRTVKSWCLICDRVIESMPIKYGVKALTVCQGCAAMVEVAVEEGAANGLVIRNLTTESTEDK